MELSEIVKNYGFISSLVAAVGGYYTLRQRVASLDERVKENENEHKENSTKVSGTLENIKETLGTQNVNMEMIKGDMKVIREQLSAFIRKDTDTREFYRGVMDSLKKN